MKMIRRMLTAGFRIGSSSAEARPLRPGSTSKLRCDLLEDRTVPASFFIANGDVAGLIAALNTANSDGQTDVIHLAKNGTYTLSAVADTIVGATGLPAVLADGDLIIQGNGATLRRDPVAPLFRLLAVNGGNLSLNRVTIANGSSDPAFPQTDGGGIRVQAGSLTATKCVFQNNQGTQSGLADGGAIGLRSNTAATITDSTFTGNSAVNGGAINSAGATALALRGCTFTNNKALGEVGPFGFAPNGGAVNVAFASTPTVTTILDSTLTGNLAATGGALAQIGGQLTIQHSTLTGNLATLSGIGYFGFSFSGGAISLAEVQSSISHSTIAGNRARLDGGGINASFGDTTLTNCTVSGNTTQFADGGGVFDYDGDFTIVNSTVSGNQAGQDGGGIATNSYFGSANLTIESSTISGNHAVRNGGGLSSYSGYLPVTATLRNSTISGNTAGGIGGGVNAVAAVNAYPTAADDILHNCTVTANTAADGGGVSHDTLGTIALNSTIVARNHDSDGAATPDLFGDVGADFSLIGDGTGGTVTGAHSLVGTAAHPIDPKLGPLANNGGPTKSHALLLGSPALNAGANVDALAFDQRASGFARVVGSASDIGAFEVQNPGLGVANVKTDDGSAVSADLSSTIKPVESGIIRGPQTMSGQDLDIPNAALTRFHHFSGVDSAVFGLSLRTGDDQTGRSTYRADFDFDGDGTIGGPDLRQFNVWCFMKQL